MQDREKSHTSQLGLTIGDPTGMLQVEATATCGIVKASSFTTTVPGRLAQS